MLNDFIVAPSGIGWSGLTVIVLSKYSPIMSLQPSHSDPFDPVVISFAVNVVKNADAAPPIVDGASTPAFDIVGMNKATG